MSFVLTDKFGLMRNGGGIKSIVGVVCVDRMGNLSSRDLMVLYE